MLKTTCAEVHNGKIHSHAACVAQQGKRVLLVDIDPQGNATSGVGIDKDACEYSVYDMLINGVNAEKIIVNTKIPTLKVIPSRIELAGAEVAEFSMSLIISLRTALPRWVC